MIDTLMYDALKKEKELEVLKLKIQSKKDKLLATTKQNKALLRQNEVLFEHNEKNSKNVARNKTLLEENKTLFKLNSSFLILKIDFTEQTKEMETLKIVIQEQTKEIETLKIDIQEQTEFRRGIIKRANMMLTSAEHDALQMNREVEEVEGAEELKLEMEIKSKNNKNIQTDVEGMKNLQTKQRPLSASTITAAQPSFNCNDPYGRSPSKLEAIDKLVEAAL